VAEIILSFASEEADAYDILGAALGRNSIMKRPRAPF